jgi:DNA-binding CsgD family transcriptional regulator
VACRFAEGYVAGVSPLRRALEAVQEEEDIRWLWLACRIASDLWDDDTWEELARRHVRVARETGALAVLPIALVYRSGTHLHAGEFAAAAALIEEASGLNRSIGGAPLMYTQILLAAWRGERAETASLLEFGIENATDRGEGRALAWGEYARALLHNGLGEYEAALAAGLPACEHDDLGLLAWALIEVVEAAARCDRPDVAAATVERLTERTQASGTDWALGIEARSRALVSEGEAADGLYREAVERLERCRVTAHLARAHLVYGEWLRREQRRTEAREQLRTAHDMFDRFGAEGFAERARRELQATGETVRRRSVEAQDVLTPQETQVARLAAEGHTNPEIGAHLFISPRTAEYHLSKVFTKLAISSRRQLRGALDQLERSTA